MPSMASKKVLLVFGGLERGGAQTRMLEVCRSLSSTEAVTFDFCVLGQAPLEILPEVEAIGGIIREIPIRSAKFGRRFSDLLRSEKYEIVHCLPNLLGGIMVWLANRQGVPVRIVSFRSTLDNLRGWTSSTPAVALMRALIARHATSAVAVSQTVMDSMFPLRWRSGCDCRVIYNGLDLAPFEAPARRRQVREEFGWPEDSKIVVSVGRFVPVKNHGVILQTAARIHERRKEVHFLLVGGGELYDQVRGLVEHYGLDGVCKMPGLRTDVPRLLLASDLYFSPSRWEGLPGALLEALAAGLPAVVSDHAAYREVAAHFPEDRVRMAGADEVERHAANILRALDTPPDRQLALEHFRGTPFDLGKSVGAYRALYGLGKS